MRYIFISLALIIFSSCDNSNINQEGKKKISIADTVNMSSKNDSSSQNETAIAEKKSNCNAFELNAYLNDPDNSGTNIRQSPGGNIVMKLVKDDQNIMFFFTITEAENEWFKLKSPIEGMENEIEIPNGEAWIHGSVISVDTRNYAGQKLTLLDKAENGKTIGVIKDVSYGLILKDICGDWAQVKYNDTIGWIEIKWLCGNPLTSCS